MKYLVVLKNSICCKYVTIFQFIIPTYLIRSYVCHPICYLSSKWHQLSCTDCGSRFLTGSICVVVHNAAVNEEVLKIPIGHELNNDVVWFCNMWALKRKFVREITLTFQDQISTSRQEDMDDIDSINFWKIPYYDLGLQCLLLRQAQRMMLIFLVSYSWCYNSLSPLYPGMFHKTDLVANLVTGIS